MTEKITIVAFQKDYINTFAYMHENNLKVSAINLWANGYKILNGATIVKNFESYKSIEFKDFKKTDLKKLEPFIYDNLMDKIRIITCFENFMKGILLLNNYIVHKLTDKNKILKKVQKKRPININEIFTLNSFSDFDKDKRNFWETNKQTINFSCMIIPEYQKIINLPKEILEIIVEINEERNNLHFINIEEIKFGKSTIEKYSKIIEFSNNTIKKSIMDLDQNLKTLQIEMKK
jgi:hypothetical protein